MRKLIPFGVAATLFAACALGQPPEPSAIEPAGNAVRLSKYILTVANLERTHAFYQALGIPLDGATDLKQPQQGSPANRTTGMPADSSFRNANNKIPGADFIFEFIEMTGVDRTPRHPRLQDPGASLLELHVRDVDSALAAARAAGAQVVTTGGAPVRIGRTRMVIVTDPDGFYINLIQPPELDDDASPGTNIVGANWATVVEDATRSANFYRDQFGFSVSSAEIPQSNPFLKVTGTPAASIVEKMISLPGSPRVWRFLEFKGIDRHPVRFAVTDPGSLQLGFQVRDIDAAAASFRAAGGAIVSRGGEIMRRPNGGGAALIRDPDGVYLETGTVPATASPAAAGKR
jgi:predicted enzyme related to lactoylglutathione lyase